MGRYKKRGLAHFWVDYFKAIVELEQGGILDTLCVNSGMAWYEDITSYDNTTTIDLLPNITSDFRSYIAIRDTKTSVFLAFIGIGSRTQKRDFFEVTWQGLIVRGGPDFFIRLARKLWVKIKKFTRVDICLDLIDVTVPYIHDTIISECDRKRLSKVFYDRKGGEQTIYFWEKSRKKNKYQLIRIYDKLEDSRKKGKEWLYPDYNEYTNVTRLELEIREEKAKYLNEEKILDVNYIFSVIIKQFYRFNYQFFWFLKFDDFLKKYKEEKSLYHERNEKIEERQKHFVLYGSSFRDDEEKKIWLATFVAYGRRLIGDGYSKKDVLDIFQNYWKE